MDGIYLINYSVKGIKSIDSWSTLSFYKKSFSGEFNLRSYCIKGIYGANGSGKSAIVSSVNILSKVINYKGILKESLFQKELHELVNKKQGILEYDVTFLNVDDKKNKMTLYNYLLSIGKDSAGNYVVTKESLSSRNARSHSEVYSNVFEIENGDIKYVKAEEELKAQFIEKTKNILSESSLSAIMLEHVLSMYTKRKNEPLMYDCISLFLFGANLYTYMDTSDDHTEYILNKMTNDERIKALESPESIRSLERSILFGLFIPSPKRKLIPKTLYKLYEKKVKKLEGFIKIFKSNLSGIIIEKREYSENEYSVDLIMDYGDYTVNAEFESTGIKKLIKLFGFFQLMVDGCIVFVDELDSNLHDVYLCALLEYLMEYGKGQLCFTTHNIGPMDVLKKNKKSIDFLSVNHTVYPWVTNGNYSPSKLYKNGMIEGSPFNIDSVDFLSVFDSGEGE